MGIRHNDNDGPKPSDFALNGHSGVGTLMDSRAWENPVEIKPAVAPQDRVKPREAVEPLGTAGTPKATGEREI